MTGGAGYVGSVVVGNLLSYGYKVSILDRFLFGGESLFSYINNENLQITRGDIRDLEVLKKAVDGMDAVIHLAALVGEPACKKNPKVTRQINFEAAKKLVLESKRAGVKRFIFSSTCSNYGDSPTDRELTEDSKLNPLSLYAETKIATENFILANVSRGFHPTILRLATIFGLSPRMRFDLMVNELAREVALGGRFHVRNKDAWRPFLHTQDISNAAITVLEAPIKKVSGKIFNVVGENIQKRQLIAFANKYPSKIKILFGENGPDDRRNYRVSAQKIRKALGWKPKISIENGFDQIVKVIKQGMFIDPYEFRYNA